MKLVVTGNFFISDTQISKQDKDWLYPQISNIVNPRKRPARRELNSHGFSVQYTKNNIKRPT